VAKELCRPIIGQDSKEVIDLLVTLYNEERPHMCLGNLTPELVHEQNRKPDRLWGNYYQKNGKIVNRTIHLV
jgi:hypothetical protein